MSKYRRAAKVDANQEEIVKALRRIPGVSVSTGHDDVLIGYRGVTYWVEIKAPETRAKRSGGIRESSIKESQKKLRETWKGHYSIVSSLEEILSELCIEG